MANAAPAKNITPQQRQAFFNQMTRQHWQDVPQLTATEMGQAQFQIPKTRLTSRIQVEVAGQLNVKHASATSFVPNDFAPYTAIESVRVEMNNGFAPFTLSGRELAMYGYIRENANVMLVQPSGRAKHVMATGASAAGVDNNFRFLMDLPLVLNKRDAIGLILTQNQETTVTVTITFSSGIKMLKTTTGYTAALKNLTVTPMVETFSVPNHPDALPDISVLKIVQSTKVQVTAGINQIKLPVGMTFRKLAIYLEDGNGVGVQDSAISSDFELVFNQADSPYRIKPSILAAINHEQFNTPLPDGLWAWDFSDNGQPGYGSPRDYVDTERLTEFWFRFFSPVSGTITAVYEMLSRLK